MPSVPFTHVTMTYVTYKHGVSLWPTGLYTTYIKIDSSHYEIFSAKTESAVLPLYDNRGSGWEGVWYSLFIRNLAHYSSH